MRTPSKRPLATAVGLALAALAQPALADVHYWACSGTTGSWASSCWSSTYGGATNLGQPGNGDNVYLVQSDATNRTMSYWNTAYSSATLSSLRIDATGSGTVTLSQSVNQPLAASFEYIGSSGSGAMVQSAGSNTTGPLYLGYFSGSNGSYTLSGSGSLKTVSTFVGYGGNGTFTQSGGSHTTTGDLVLASQSGSAGSYTLSGGALNVGGNITGGAGTSTLSLDGGTLNVVGGSISVGYLNVASVAGSNHTYTMNTGQTLTAYSESIGNRGTGAFVQNGGSNTVTVLNLGDWASVSGAYTLAGGQLKASTESIGEFTTGVFTHSGGSNTVDKLYLGGTHDYGVGTYHLSGGAVLSAGYEGIGSAGYGSGVFNQAGGSNSVTDKLTIAAYSSGTYNLSGGTLSAATETIAIGGTGIFNQTSGTHTVAGDLVMAEYGYSTGTYNLSGGNLAVSGNIVGGTGTSTINVDGGTLSVKGGSIAVNGFNVGNAAGSSGSFTLSGTTSLTATDEYTGKSGIGRFNQSGGTNTLTGGLILGLNAGSNGTYNLTGGTLSVGAFSSEAVGVSGTGTFNQSGGTNSAGALYLGHQNGGSGTYNQTGGTNSVGAIIMAESGGSGTYTLSGGTLNLGYVWSGTGNSTMNLDGGTLSFFGGYYTPSISVGALNIANAAGSTFTLALAAGQTITAGTETLGNGGIGNVVQTGGSNTAGTLVVTSGTYTLSGGTLTVNSAMDNSDRFVVAGGTINGTGALTNNGEMSGTGTIAGSGGFANNGFLAVSGGNLTLSNTGANSNAGNLDLAAGLQLKLVGATLANDGTIALNGGSVTGTGALANNANGTISGRGTIGTAFANAGTLVVDGGTTTVTKGFANSGIVQLGGNAAALSGGLIGNSGRIEGYGKVNNAISNTGAIEAKGGTLTLTAGMSNNAGSLVAGNGATLLFKGGLAANGGEIRLNGGALDNSGHTLVNNGQIQVSTGASQIYGSVTGAANSKIIVSGNGAATFYDDVEVQANSELRVSAGATVTFFSEVRQRTGSMFTGTGDKFYEGGLAIGGSPGYGYDAGSVTFGDTSFYTGEIGGTTACTLACATDDALRNASFDKYAVAGKLSFGGKLILTSWNGFVGQAGQTYDLFDWGSTAGSFSSIDAAGFKIAAGTHLDFSHLYTDGSISVVGQAAPVPEPETYAMLLAGLGVMGAFARRRKAA